MSHERPRKVINVLISEREEWFIQAVSEALHRAICPTAQPSRTLVAEAASGPLDPPYIMEVSHES